MPLAKIHIVEGRYDEDRLAKISGAIQAALMNTLRVPPDDFYQLIFEFPKKRFLHTPSFVGMRYTDDLIILDLTFIEGRSKETRLALLKDVNSRVAAAAGISPDDLMITLYEAPGENFSFGRGEAQRANAVPRQWKPHPTRSFAEQAMATTIEVNGVDRMVDVDCDTSLWVLRDVERRGGHREAATSLDTVPHSRRISKANPLIMLAAFALTLLTGMEVAVADSAITRRVLQIEHVKIDSAKTFAEVAAALESAIPLLDPAISAALTDGDEQRAKELERGSELFIFLKRDHGALLQVTDRPQKTLQYEIGNPLTATRMTRREIPAALYAPLRVVLYENAAGRATFEYDKPSTLFGQFGDEQVTAVGRELDAELERALRRAAE
jgi:uncharacterized protein (DUF302 family)/phenylpyruvate tautomerase PptA (4-oxalocrotonate tautomerase family)